MFLFYNLTENILYPHFNLPPHHVQMLISVESLPPVSLYPSLPEPAHHREAHLCSHSRADPLRCSRSATNSNIHKAANLWQVLVSHQGFPSDCMQIPSVKCPFVKQNWNNLVFQEVKTGRGNNASYFHAFPRQNIFLCYY